MNEGDIVLIDLPQSGGGSKLRPALILKQLPQYTDFLVPESPHKLIST